MHSRRVRPRPATATPTVAPRPAAAPPPAAGTKRSYYLITPAPPQSVEVLPGQVVQIYPTVTPQPLSPLGAAPAPALAPLLPEDAPGEGEGGGGEGAAAAAAPSELLICRDSGSFFVGPDGKARGGARRGAAGKARRACAPGQGAAAWPRGVHARGARGLLRSEAAALFPG
jgi:hypothetical protein